MKVAHIVPSFYPAVAYGGPTESVYRLCRAMAGPACEVRALTTNANGPEAVLDLPVDKETVIQDHLSVRYCARQRAESVSVSLLGQLPAYLRWADIVHLEAVYSFPTIPTLWLAARLHKPVVWSPRGALARWKGARNPGLKNIYDWLCRLGRGRELLFHFTSVQEQDGSARRFPGAEGVVIPNGVEIPQISERPGLEPETFRLLTLGRLDPIKGIENLLEACELLKARPVRAWQLTVAGGGDAAYTARLQRLIRDGGLEGRVHMIGPVRGQQKEAAFAAADVVVVPSHSENFCIVAAEALARRIPVIASRGTPWSGLESKGCGLWVSNDPKSLAAAIERMQTLPLRPMGDRGRAWIEGEFTWNHIAARMMSLYERVLERPK